MTATKTARVANTLTDLFLVAIVLSVGLMAGAASFNHVHDWTMHNSPPRTAGWFGWANAVITELIPTATLIIIARRRRTGGSIRYPMFLLVAAVGLSLTAQLAVARFTVFGWMVSALPAVAFFALSKLVFTATRTKPTSTPATAEVATVEAALHQLATRVHQLETRPTPPQVSALTPATAAPAPPTGVPAGATVRPAAKKTPAKKTTSARRAPAKKTAPTKATTSAKPVSTVDEPVQPLPVPEPEPPATVKLLPQARIYAQAHQSAHGTPITPGQLAVRMRVGTDLAEQILNQLDTIPTTPNREPHNGTPITTSGAPA
jgi:hypothetical protein